MQIPIPRPQIHQGIADQLPRPVPGEIAAPVDADRGSLRIRQVAPVAARADGVDTGMFQEQQGFGFTAGGDPGDEPLLQAQGGLEIHDAAIDDPTHVAFGWRAR